MSRPAVWPGVLAVCVALGAAGDGDKEKAARVARQILDDARPASERETLVKEHPALSDSLIAAMVADLTPGTKEEYRRIPWIWRVAIAAGKRNDADELRRLLAVSLPEAGGRLDDWRAVVVGGGLINGVSQAGAWPGPRIVEALKGQDALAARWREAVTKAEAMADDPRVPTGTRYDALRVVGVEPWDRCAGRLFRYLVKEVHPELQMGAVSGLSDVPEPAAGVAQALISGVGHYADRNLELALDALLRDEGRVAALLDAVGDGRIKKERLGAKRLEALTQHPSESLRKRAAELLGR